MSSQISPSMFTGFPSGYFVCTERRSQTVLMIDAGQWDVHAVNAPETHAGRFATFAEALNVKQNLARIWKAAPFATPAQILAFATNSTADALAQLVTRPEVQNVYAETLAATNWREVPQCVALVDAVEIAKETVRALS